jgi:hypothetical protein
MDLNYVMSNKPPGNQPRLLLIYHNRFPTATLAAMRENLNRALAEGKHLIIDGGVEVFQLVEGRWIHLDGSIELTDVPKEPKKISFREFL